VGSILPEKFLLCGVHADGVGYCSLSETIETLPWAPWCSPVYGWRSPHKTRYRSILKTHTETSCLRAYVNLIYYTAYNTAYGSQRRSSQYWL
jgi:hypothetical protein